MTENEWMKLTAAVDDCFVGKPERLIRMVRDYELQKVFDLVASLREELHEANKEVGRLEEELESTVDDLNGEISELEDKVWELETVISDMKEFENRGE